MADRDNPRADVAAAFARAAADITADHGHGDRHLDGDGVGHADPDRDGDAYVWTRTLGQWARLTVTGGLLTFWLAFAFGACAVLILHGLGAQSALRLDHLPTLTLTGVGMVAGALGLTAAAAVGVLNRPRRVERHPGGGARDAGYGDVWTGLDDADRSRRTGDRLAP